MYYTPSQIYSILVLKAARVENSVDPDLIASSEASWSGSTLFQQDEWPRA